MAERKPDFENLLAVLRRERPSRPTLFEFFLNDPLLERLTGFKAPTSGKTQEALRFHIKAFTALGYDYVTTMLCPDWNSFLPKAEIHRKESISLNESSVITNREEFERFPWKTTWSADILNDCADDLPDGMRIVAYGPGGLLENVISLTGFDNLCYILADDPALAKDLFDRVGGLLLKYYEDACTIPEVGACIVNDDWGFKTQTMLSTSDLRTYVVPWHKKMAELIRSSGRPSILHSCGCLSAVMDDVIGTIGFSAKHSYEDAIQPVEQAYEQYGKRIAVLGGIDVDFLIRSPVEVILKRCRDMLERTEGRGSYALGSGNSIAPYIPDEKYLAMRSAVIP
jgi:uroporphyrinogen decarboxylase